MYLHSHAGAGTSDVQRRVPYHQYQPPPHQPPPHPPPHPPRPPHASYDQEAHVHPQHAQVHPQHAHAHTHTHRVRVDLDAPPRHPFRAHGCQPLMRIFVAVVAMGVCMLIGATAATLALLPPTLSIAQPWVSAVPSKNARREEEENTGEDPPAPPPPAPPLPRTQRRRGPMRHPPPPPPRPPRPPPPLASDDGATTRRLSTGRRPKHVSRSPQ
jgi:hypothetical protein